MIRMAYYIIGGRWSPEFLLYADDWMAICGGMKELKDIWGADHDVLGTWIADEMA